MERQVDALIRSVHIKKAGSYNFFFRISFLFIFNAGCRNRRCTGGTVILQKSYENWANEKGKQGTESLTVREDRRNRD